MCVSCVFLSHVSALVCARLPIPSREVFIPVALAAFQASITPTPQQPCKVGECYRAGEKPLSPHSSSQEQCMPEAGEVNRGLVAPASDRSQGREPGLLTPCSPP